MSEAAFIVRWSCLIEFAKELAFHHCRNHFNQGHILKVQQVRNTFTLNRCIFAMGVIVVCLMCSDVVLAQVPAPGNAPVSNTTTISRPLYFEILITVVMCGVALFTVCRNSNRN